MNINAILLIDIPPDPHLIRVHVNHIRCKKICCHAAQGALRCCQGRGAVGGAWRRLSQSAGEAARAKLSQSPLQQQRLRFKALYPWLYGKHEVLWGGFYLFFSQDSTKQKRLVCLLFVPGGWGVEIG